MRRYGLTLGSLTLGLWVAACGGDESKPGDTSSPDTADTSDVFVPDTATPDTSTPDTSTPDTSTPDTSTPDTSLPDSADTEDDTDQPAELAIAKGDRCSALTPIDSPALPFADDGDTTGLADDYIYTTGTACGGVGNATWGDASPDLVYAFTAPESGAYVFTVDPADAYDPALMITDACPPIGEDGFTGLDCVGVSDQGTEGATETMKVQLRAGRTYYLLIDGWNNDQPIAGAYSLDIALGEDCQNGDDDNDDGKADCADPQCVDDPVCDESTFPDGCSNGDDDDRDGATDCADEDCSKLDACDESSYPKGCSNGDDDDGDGKTDCADTDCDGDADCDESTFTDGCTNDKDDDGDGRTDCADPNCGDEPTCDEASFTDGCTNAQDDEGDGKTDCEDPDCGADPSCLGPAETCAEAPALELGVPVSGTTEGRVNDYGTTSASCLFSSSTSSSFGGGAPDAAYKFTAQSAGLYHVTALGDFDLGLTVTADCTFSSGVCYAAEDGVASDGESLVVELAAGQAVYVIVDGWSNTNSSNYGTFEVEVDVARATEVETNCEDQRDQDGDGDVDCADRDCAFAIEACTESGKCGDSVDNDADGDTDCDDSDCRVDPVACPAPPGDNCGTPATVSVGAPAVFDTCDFAVDFDLDATDCYEGGTGAPDGIAKFVAPAAGTYFIEQDNGGEYDSVMNLVKGNACPATIGECVAAEDGFGDVEATSIALAAGETLWIITTGYGDPEWGEADCGATTVRVSTTEAEVCDDDVDNDRDDATDCEDADCDGTAACDEAANGANACGDGADNDGDGLADCNDGDCADDTVACPNGRLGDSCAAPTRVTSSGLVATFDTCGATDNFKAVSGGSGCGINSTSSVAPDLVLEFVAPVTAAWHIESDDDYDGLLNVVDGTLGCPGATYTTCLDGGDTPEAYFSTVQGQTYYIILDGWGSACGKHAVTLRQLPPEVCDDDLDNDEDGDTDCDDTDCDTTGFCNEAVNGAGACGDAQDNDADGYTDCFDADCATEAECPGGLPGDTCADAIVIDALPFAESFDTCAYTNDFSVTESNGCAGTSTSGHTGADVVAKFTAPADGTYMVRYEPGFVGDSFDAVLNVVKAATCPASPISACVVGSDDGVPEKGSLTATAGEVFWIFVDAYWSSCDGGQLSVFEVEPEVCNDGVDNDGDELTDCKDSDCDADLVACPPPGGETCESPYVLTLGSPAAVDSCEYAKDFTSAGTGGCLPTDLAPDVVFSFTAATAGTYRFTIAASWIDFETVTNFVRGATCPASPLTSCAAGNESSSGAGTQTRDLAMTAGETMWLVLGSNYDEDECGDATVTVTKL